MQINMVHALIALLRQQPIVSGTDEVPGKKQAVLDQLLTEARETNMRISSLEQALRNHRADAIAQQRNTWDDPVHEDRARQNASSIKSATVDAINQSVTERHGRSWRVSEVSGDSQMYVAANKLFWLDQSIECSINGLAERFEPSQSDFEQALEMSDNSFLQTGELLRLRAMRLDAIESNGDQFRLWLVAAGCLILVGLLAMLF